METIFAKDATDKGLISNKQLLYFNIKKTKQLKQKMSRSINTFLQGRHVDGQQAYEKMISNVNY